MINSAPISFKCTIIYKSNNEICNKNLCENCFVDGKMTDCEFLLRCVPRYIIVVQPFFSYIHISLRIRFPAFSNGFSCTPHSLYNCIFNTLPQRLILAKSKQIWVASLRMNQFSSSKSIKIKRFLR